MSLVIVLILFMIDTFAICHSSLIEKALCYQITFLMEFPVNFIERPRLYGDVVTFLVHWGSGEVTEEEVKELIPGSVLLIEEFLIEYEHTMTDLLREKILAYFK